MSKRNPQLDAVLAELRAAGATPEVNRRRRGHIEVRWVGADGRTRQYFMACTPGDDRGTLNARATVRRMLRQGPASQGQCK